MVVLSRAACICVGFDLFFGAQGAPLGARVFGKRRAEQRALVRVRGFERVALRSDEANVPAKKTQ